MEWLGLNGHVINYSKFLCSHYNAILFPGNLFILLLWKEETLLQPPCPSYRYLPFIFPFFSICFFPSFLWGAYERVHKHVVYVHVSICSHTWKPEIDLRMSFSIAFLTYFLILGLPLNREINDSGEISVRWALRSTYLYHF